MKKIIRPVACVLFTSFISAILILCGCESGEGTAALTITPSAVYLSGTTNNVTLYVGGTSSGTNGAAVTTSGGLRSLSEPLEWRVTNPALGTILESSGNMAVYARYPANGVNTVIVKDQYDAEGFATIHQQ